MLKHDGDFMPWNILRVFTKDGLKDIRKHAPQREVQVAIIDTGIDALHPDLLGAVTWEVSTVPYEGVQDFVGHGTHLAGTIGARDNDFGIVGINPNAEIYSIKAFNSSQIAEWDWVENAIYLAVQGPDGIVGTEDDADIISMSFDSLGEVPPASLHDAIKFAYQHGTVLVAAAGNQGDGNPYNDDGTTWPAAYPEVIAVGGTGIFNELLSFSQTGPSIELSAPGTFIVSTFLNNQYLIAAGTSMAVAHATGVISLLLSEGYSLPIGTQSDLTPTTLRGLLHATALELGPAGYDYGYGHGLVQY